jgi:hypothetical protein
VPEPVWTGAENLAPTGLENASNKQSECRTRINFCLCFLYIYKVPGINWYVSNLHPVGVNVLHLRVSMAHRFCRFLQSKNIRLVVYASFNISFITSF